MSFLKKISTAIRGLLLIFRLYLFTGIKPAMTCKLAVTNPTVDLNSNVFKASCHSLKIHFYVCGENASVTQLHKQ